MGKLISRTHFTHLINSARRVAYHEVSTFRSLARCVAIEINRRVLTRLSRPNVRYVQPIIRLSPSRWTSWSIRFHQRYRMFASEFAQVTVIKHRPATVSTISRIPRSWRASTRKCESQTTYDQLFAICGKWCFWPVWRWPSRSTVSREMLSERLSSDRDRFRLAALKVYLNERQRPTFDYERRNRFSFGEICAFW